MTKDKDTKHQATEEFYHFYHEHITKKEFEDEMEGIMSYYSAKMLPDSERIAKVLSYCRDKLFIKPPIMAKNDLTWLRLATTKMADVRYDLDSVKFNGQWSWGCDGVRCHAVERQIHPDLKPGDKITRKGETITPTPPEEARDMDSKDVIKDVPDINKLLINPEEMVEVSLKPLPNKTYAYSHTIIDTFRIESKCPTLKFDGELISFNRRYIREAIYHMGSPKVHMISSRMAPFMFTDGDLMALVMPTYSDK